MNISMKPHRVVSKATTSEGAAALRSRGAARTHVVGRVNSMSTTSSSQGEREVAAGLVRKAALSMGAAVLVLGASEAEAWSAPQPVVADLAQASAPVERKKGKVVRQVVKTKNFAEEGPVSIPTLPSLPGANYSKNSSAQGSKSSSGSLPSISLPSFSLPSFSGPSVSLPTFSAPSVSYSESSDITPSTQAVGVFGAEVLAAGLATATVGALTKEN
jgi:hypothetical protein